MKKTTTYILAGVALLAGCAAQPSQSSEVSMKNLYEIEVETIDGKTQKLEDYKGKVLLIVNTASKCGFTKQYDGLQKLYETYKTKGLIILGFPSNDFLRQEPGTNSEIKSFCKLNYGVEFPMFAKIKVKGKQQHPLYTWLTSKQTNPEHSGKISWNFNKFLISRSGSVIARFGSRTEPMDKKVTTLIENALKEE